MIDDHPLVQLGIRQVLEDAFEVHESASREDALCRLRDIGDFDVAIIDMRCRGDGDGSVISGTETIREMRRLSSALGIVAHGERADRHTATLALQAGASAYVARTATPTALRRAVDAAAAQESFVDPAVPPKGSRGKLTRRQREIMQLLANGESSLFAARELDLSEETVKTHMKNAMARLGARNRTHAVAMAIRESLID